jgi:hypothetical protein
VETAVEVGAAKCVESRLALAVLLVLGHNQRGIEKDLLHFCFGDSMLFVLAGVAFVPLKAGIRHLRPLYISAIYHQVGNFASGQGKCNS